MKTSLKGGGMIPVRRPSLRQALSVTVMPVPRRGASPLLEIGSPPPAALVIVNPDMVQAPSEHALQCLFGLTPAEARLAAAFARGDSLQGYAEAAERSLNYVRWLLKQVQAKTDTRSQADLVRLLVGQVATLTTGDQAMTQKNHTPSHVVGAHSPQIA